LLRGLTRESRHWGDFPQIFRHEIEDAQVEGVQVIALDMPGNGSLHAMRSPLGVDAMADYCRAELARRGVAPPYNILAMSLGAMVTVSWASRYPAEVAACVLINTSLRSLSPFFHRLRPANYPVLLKLALGVCSAYEREQIILRVTSRRADGGTEAHAHVLQNWVAYRQQYSVSRMNAMRQLWAAATCRAASARPAARILILTSAHDALVDTRCSQALAMHWQVPIVVHPDAGHDIPLDDGRWVARQVRSWLAGQMAQADAVDDAVSGIAPESEVPARRSHTD
jgi:pimeloyl-ACP methyl ester carboxylesterase